MIDEKRLNEYMEEVKKEMKILGASAGFIKKHLTKDACIHGIINNESPETIAQMLLI